jgi:enamine deaminase RidA (YjgF/YER057c/UK114 family)
MVSKKFKLHRIGRTKAAPVPESVRVGDFIYTSSIYPIDDSGHAITVDERLGETGPALISAQTRHCLETLKRVLEEQQSSLDRVLKADVHLAEASDFYEFKLVWREYFPIEPPARATIEVGQCFPIPNVRLNLDVVALAGDSTFTRQVLSDPSGLDPLEAEWATAAVRAGQFVFCSAFTASDFKSGMAVGKLPAYPNYGNNAEMQAEYVYAGLDRVLGTAGTSLANAVDKRLYEPDLLTFHDVDKVGIRYMPMPPPRSSIGVKGLIVPKADFVASFTVLVPDENHTKEGSRKGINWHPSKKVNFTPTIKAGEWRFFAGNFASPDFMRVEVAPAGLPNHLSDIEVQTRCTMELLREQIEANETDWAHCHHVRVFLLDVQRNYRGFIRVWREYFPDPDQSPALCVVPATALMYPGPIIEINPTCVAL